MSCELRDPWLDGTLSPSDRARFERHHAECAHCQRAVAQWQALGHSLRTAYAPWQVASPAQTRALLAQAATRRRARGVAVPLALAGVALAAGLLVFTRPTPVSPTLIAADHATVQAHAFETADAGRAVVALGQDRLGLGPGTLVELTRADARATRLTLRRGVLAVDVDHRDGRRDFEVATPQGVVAVVGTRFRLAVRERQLRLEVAEGEVRLRLASETQRVPAGQQAVVEGDALRLEGGTTVRFQELESVAPSDEQGAAPVEPIDAVDAVDAGPPARLVVPTPPVAAWRARAARGECPAVVRDARQFLAQWPTQRGAWLVLGDCARRAHESAAAVTAYLEAAKDRGTEADDALWLAASLQQDELGQPGIETLQRYLARHPPRGLQAAAMVRLARGERQRGHEPEARALLEKVIANYADTAAASEALRLRQP